MQIDPPTVNVPVGGMPFALSGGRQVQEEQLAPRRPRGRIAVLVIEERVACDPIGVRLAFRRVDQREVLGNIVGVDVMSAMWDTRRAVDE